MRINGWHVVAAFQTFGGKPLAMLDAIQNLEPDELNNLVVLLHRIEENIKTIADCHADPEIRLAAAKHWEQWHKWMHGLEM